MSHDIEFNQAVERSKQLPQKPSNNELLQLYGLYKQATEGDNQATRPTGFDIKAIAKHDAWAELQGMPAEEARAKYIELVALLESKYA